MKESRKEETRQQISTSPVCPDCMYPVEPEWNECPFCAAREAIPWRERTRDAVKDLIDLIAESWELLLGERTARLFAALFVGSYILSTTAFLLGLIFYLIDFLR